MKSEERTVYWCEHCNKRYLSEYWCGEHEMKCSQNPENDRACFSCVHLEMDNDARVYVDPYGYGYGEQEISVNAFYCKKLDKYVIPPKAEHKGNAYEFGDTLNEPMPKECEYQNEYDTIDI